MVAEALAAGHSVTISPRIDLYGKSSKLLELQKQGARILKKPYPIRGIDNILSKFREELHYRKLFSPKPDVVLINNGGGYEGLFSASMIDRLHELSVPYVVGCRLIYEAGSLHPEEMTRAVEFFSRASSIVYPSHRNLVTAERHLAQSLPNGVVLHSPVNLSAFGAVAWPTKDPVYMASVARLEPNQKGQDILFESLQSSTWMSRNWKLRLYGSGRKKEYLADLARHYGIAERVEFSGFVKDVRSIWSQNHLLVLPSRDEGAPIALIEAMLCGRPSVVTEIGGNAEWVEDGVTGFVAGAPNTKLFGSALERAWQAQGAWEKMGQRAQQSAWAKYDKNPGASLLNILLSSSARFR